MRLSKAMIKYLSDAIAANLESKGLAEYEVPAGKISDLVADVITEDMLAEEKLNKDVEKLLAPHEAEMARGMMDYRKMFDLTKQKLAKERGIVL